MSQENVVKERRERIALACLQGFLACPYLLIPDIEKFSQEEVYRGIVRLSVILADEFIQEIDEEKV